MGVGGREALLYSGRWFGDSSISWMNSSSAVRSQKGQSKAGLAFTQPQAVCARGSVPTLLLPQFPL